MFQVLLLCLFIHVFFGTLSAQNRQPCKVTKSLGGKYKFVGSETNIIEGKKIFFLKIKIKPKNFTKEYLLQTAQRIKETYCDEDRIDTEIIDSSDNREFDDLIPPPIFSPATKALYSIDRTTGKEIIQFVSSDKITDEIKINK